MTRPEPPSIMAYVARAAAAAAVALAVAAAAIGGVFALEIVRTGDGLFARAAPRDAEAEDGAALPSELARAAAPDDAATLAGGAGSATSADAEAASPRSFNVLLVTIDTLRWDLGFMGYPRPVTPNLDRLAARAAVFERAYATASYTPKALGPLLIGRYASETFRDGEHYTTFYPANVFLAERLRDAGHATLAALCHHYFKWPTGFDQGFDVWDTSATPPTMSDNDPTLTSPKLTDVAIDLLSRAGDRPRDDGDGAAGDGGAARPDGSPRRFFGWFHYMDPHLPYVAHDDAPDLVGAAPDAAPPERALYDGEVWFTDKHVGRLLDFVASQPWSADTAIIVTADHGEAFGERGFYRHGREVWEAVVRVPLLVYVPGAPPRRIDAKRSHVDLVPTILELMRAPPADNPPARGTSLVADVMGDPDAPVEDRDVFIDMPEGPHNEARRALITDGTPGLKAIDFGGRYEVYDLAVDPEELRPVAEPARVRDAIGKLERARSELREQPVGR